MRRKEREVKDLPTIRSILGACKVCRVAVQDSAGLYIVPMSFGYAFRDEALHLYFHSAGQGRKVAAFRQSPAVAFEMDCNCELVPGATACDYACTYQSIIGNGVISPVTVQEEKAAALTAIMKQQTGEDFLFREQMTKSVCVYEITSTDFTAKQYIK